jgi:hypothetical protein
MNDATDTGATTPTAEVPPVVVAPVRAVSPAEAGRSHLDAIEIAQVIMPAIIALTIIVCYLVQVIQTGNTDSQLGSSLPVIVVTYFGIAGATTRHRRG